MPSHWKVPKKNLISAPKTYTYPYTFVLKHLWTFLSLTLNELTINADWLLFICDHLKRFKLRQNFQLPIRIIRWRWSGIFSNEVSYGQGVHLQKKQGAKQKFWKQGIRPKWSPNRRPTPESWTFRKQKKRVCLSEIRPGTCEFLTKRCEEPWNKFSLKITHRLVSTDILKVV